MNNGWNSVAIGEVCDSIFDGPHATPKKTTDGPIFLGISNLQNGQINLSETEHLSEEDFIKWTRRVTPQENDIVFSYETRLGEAALVPKGLRFCLGRRMALIRPDKNKVVPRFLLYAYLGPEFQQTIHARTVHGSTVDRIPLIEFPSFPISLPSLSEQQAIADFLGALDDKIELNRRMNRTLDSMTRAVFQELTKEEIGRETTIGEAVTVVGGSTPSTANSAFWEGGDIHWATPKDLAALQSPVLLDTNSRITEQGLQEISSGLLPAGTVLLSSRAPIGYLAITEIPTAINQGFIAIKCTEEVPNYFILNWLKDNMEEIVGRANGTTFLEISKSNFRPMRIFIPSPERMKGFVQNIEPLYKKIVANLKESRTLARLRDTLLPKLMRGEVRVKDV
jgi:type I restriction enzyme, S subunit